VDDLSDPARMLSRMKTGTATLPLHGGKAPAWLFSRMRLMAREITLAIVSEYSPQELLRRLTGSDLDPEPYLEYLRSKFA